MVKQVTRWMDDQIRSYSKEHPGFPRKRVALHFDVTYSRVCDAFRRRKSRRKALRADSPGRRKEDFSKIFQNSFVAKTIDPA